MVWWMWLLLILVLLSLIVLIVLLLLWARRRKEGTDQVAQVIKPTAEPAQATAGTEAVVEETVAEVKEAAEAAAPEVKEVVEEAEAETAEVATEVEEVAEEAEAAATEVKEAAEIAEPMASRMPEAVPTKPPPPDDLKIVEGIGPKISGVLQAAGITTWAQLAATDVDELKRILAKAKIRLGDPGTWPEQASLAAEARWDELSALQDSLKGGRRV